ncbi:MAG: patatin-like phospholipase family protein [Rhizobiaceae bacterium]|nr:patatin-like phospholipase family protein [Rhizobiaceae bacterium]
MTADLRIGLALGGGGARGIAHIHVLSALDDLGVRPAHIAGSSIGAIIGAAYAGGMSGRDIEAFALQTFATPRALAGRLWATRPPNFKEFWADGGFRLGQLNAKRVLAAFLPPVFARRFEELTIPLTVVATDFYARRELVIRTGDLMSALAASAALPAVFRPVRREGLVLLDGGIYSPLPFDLLRDMADAIVAVDVNGGPEGDGSSLPAPFQAMVGASQLMQQALIETKLMIDPPDILFRPPVARFGVLDFMRTRTILAETVSLREEAKHAIGRLLERPHFDVEAAIAALQAHR